MAGVGQTADEGMNENLVKSPLCHCFHVVFSRPCQQILRMILCGPKKLPQLDTSRRTFLAATGTAVLAASLSSDLSASLSPSGTGRFRRMNLADPKAAQDLASYERAIGALLKLPPSDPRNWYRIALHPSARLSAWELVVSTLAPRLSWLVGDHLPRGKWRQGLALPYWDWTAQPRLPASFLIGNLNPANFPLETLDNFKKTFADPLEAFWKGLSPDQLSQLKLRNYNSLDDVWKDITGDPTDPDKPSKFSEPGYAKPQPTPYSRI